jgi:hypothetical protein
MRPYQSPLATPRSMSSMRLEALHEILQHLDRQRSSGRGSNGRTGPEATPASRVTSSHPHLR